MWPGVQNIIHNLLWEILSRVLIITIVCIFQLKVPPRMCHITEAELLSHYKRPRHDSCIPAWLIVIIVVFVPLFCIYTVFTTTKNYVDTMQAMLAWTLALSITAMVTESLKLLVGRPRPDFFYRCFPNGEITLGLRCTGNLQDVIEGRKSFPSGHSSFSFCSLGFLSLWISPKLNMCSTQIRQSSKLFVLFTPLVVAGIVACSRHFDNHHHWEDIIVGSILGLVSSYFCYHQYYHPLNSAQSGEPLTDMTQEELFESYEMECCTRNLNDDLYLMFRLSNKNSFVSSK